MELEKLKLHQGEAWHKAIIKAIRSIFMTKRLDGLGAKLDEYQKLLNTGILAQLNAQDILQCQNFASLSLDVRTLAAGLEQGHRTVADLLPTLSRSFQKHVECSLLMHEQKREAIRQQDEFKKSLFFPEMFARQTDIVEARDETCHWIFSGHNKLSHPLGVEGCSFPEWLERGKDAYWLSGKPGSGKSTLMKYLSNQLDSAQPPPSIPTLGKWAAGSDILVISFFFWALGTPEQRNYAGFLKSSLYQISAARKDFVPALMEKQKISCGPLEAWTVARLEATFRHFLVQKPKSMSLCFVIDGLDEFGGDYQDKLLQTIRLLAQTPRTRVCVSSRPEQIFQQGFVESPQMRLEELNLHAIAEEANAELSLMLSTRFVNDERVIEGIIKSIALESRGIFLWASLVIRDLKEGLTNADEIVELFSRLSRLPKTVEGMYEHMLSKLDQSYLSDAAKYFQMIMEHQASTELTLLHFKYAAEPVQVASSSDGLAGSQLAELNDACCRLEKRIITRCGGLVEVGRRRLSRIGNRITVGNVHYQGLPTSEEETNVARHHRSVNFIHRSVVEFLQKHHRFSDILNMSFAASEATACGRLGVMGLLPAMVCRMDGLEQSTVRLLDFASQIMAVNPLMECLDLNEDLRSNNEFWSNLIEHTFQLMHRVNTTMSNRFSRCREYERLSELDELGELGELGDARPFFIGDESLPFHDTAGFAAFFGCHTYIARHGNFHGADYSRRRYLSHCAILAMDYLTRPEGRDWNGLEANEIWTRPQVARFLGLQKILIECLQFEGHFVGPIGTPQENASQTANIDLTWATVLRASIELMIRSIYTLKRPDLDRGLEADQIVTRMIDNWRSLAAIFLAEGVNVNHLLYPQIVQSGHSPFLRITIEATPLSIIKHSLYPNLVIENPPIRAMVSFLSAHGAVDEYSFWSIRCEEFAVLTDVQATFLKKIRPWEWGCWIEGGERSKPTVSRPKDPDPYSEKVLEELRDNPYSSSSDLRSDRYMPEAPWFEDSWYEE